jgi:hypothetical protein
MDRLQFRETVEILLKDELGSLAGGNPAIWIDSGDVPTKVTGLLCVIERFETIRSTQPSSNYSMAVNFDWVLRLVQRDRSPPGLEKLDRAVEKLRHEFPIHQERSLPPSDGAYPQITFFCNFTRSSCHN